MFDSELPGSPEQVIGSFKDGKTTYAKIFECLCVYVKFNFTALLEIYSKLSVPLSVLMLRLKYS